MKNCRTNAAAIRLVDTAEDTAKLVGIDNYQLELALVSFALPVQVLNKNFSVFSKKKFAIKNEIRFTKGRFDYHSLEKRCVYKPWAVC